VPTVDTRRSITSATTVSFVLRPETRWCSTSLSVRMPDSLPSSSTGICEMPCCLNSSVARPSRSFRSSEMTSRRPSERITSATVPTSQSPFTKPCWRIQRSSTNFDR
jgi:hypothetical protein